MGERSSYLYFLGFFFQLIYFVYIYRIIINLQRQIFNLRVVNLLDDQQLIIFFSQKFELNIESESVEFKLI